MDASLNTNDTSRDLRMSDIRLFADGSGGSCKLEVVAAPFSGSVDFFFDTPRFRDFVEHLGFIQQSLSGEARLGQQFEESYVAFRGDGQGHIVVSGVLTDTREQMQQLRFCFVTDQTALADYISSLRKVTCAA